jgi:hypothetical protein
MTGGAKVYVGGAIGFFGTAEPSAEGARVEASAAPRGWGVGRGLPLPSRLGGLGERRKLPQRGPGQSPGRQRFLVHFGPEERRWWHSKCDILAT